MTQQNQHRFQVDLRGLIELLSRHLYSGPSVFVREMLQNGIDAINARRRVDPLHAGTLQIELIQSGSNPATLVFQDDGIGLNESQIHEFLSTIGQSSKRAGMVERPEDFIGQFGIGLLSCFMVTDEIVVISRSAADENSPAVEWRGQSDGTYSVRVLGDDFAVGTQVFLRAKEYAEEFYEPERIIELLKEYGEYLELDINFVLGGRTTPINSQPPWRQDVENQSEKESLLDYGSSIFERRFFDVIPLNSVSGEVDGLAYVLSESVHAGSKQNHRVYLKNMLLSSEAHDLLPDWAFFVQGIVNASALKPTASRESFYEDITLEQTRDELGDCLRNYLVEMSKTDPRRFQQFLGVHQLAVKALALEDDECLRLFVDWLPFDTTLGRMTFGEFREQHSTIRYVVSDDQFRQISQVAAAESIPVVNAGYVYDAELMERIGQLQPELEVEPFDSSELADRFEELTLEEREATVEFERFADAVLQQFKCVVDVGKFHPADMPSLYVTNSNANFLRSIEQSQEVADDLWTDVLGQMAEDVSATYSRLHLNYLNPLIKKISKLDDREAVQRCVETLYVQALLLGHIPLKQNELKLLSGGLIGLIDWALDCAEGKNDE